MGVPVNADENGAGPVTTPIFDALLTEFALEWTAAPSERVWDPDAPNAWFDPTIEPDPAAVRAPDG